MSLVVSTLGTVVVCIVVACMLAAIIILIWCEIEDGRYEPRAFSDMKRDRERLQRASAAFEAERRKETTR